MNKNVLEGQDGIGDVWCFDDVLECYWFEFLLEAAFTQSK